jgi:hypothetical protein
MRLERAEFGMGGDPPSVGTMSEPTMRPEPRISFRAARLAETVAGTPDESYFHNVANGQMGVH